MFESKTEASAYEAMKQARAKEDKLGLSPNSPPKESVLKEPTLEIPYDSSPTSKKSRSVSEIPSGRNTPKNPGGAVGLLSKLLAGKKQQQQKKLAPTRIEIPRGNNSSTTKLLASLYDIDELKNERDLTIQRIGDIQEQMEELQKEMDTLMENKQKLDNAVEELEEKYSQQTGGDDEYDEEEDEDEEDEDNFLGGSFVESPEVFDTESGPTTPNTSQLQIKTSDLSEKSSPGGVSKIEEVSEQEEDKTRIEEVIESNETRIDEIKEEKTLTEKKKRVKSLKVKKFTSPPWEYYINCKDDENIEKLFKEEDLKIFSKFEETDDDSNIIFEDNGRIKYATVEKIVQKITNNEYDINHDAIHTLLLTYRSFITGPELLKVIELRYNTPPNSSDISNEDFAIFYKTTLYPIRKCVTQILSRWISQHYSDFREDKNLRNDFIEFSKSLIKTKMKAEGELLTKIAFSHMNRLRTTFEEQQWNEIYVKHPRNKTTQILKFKEDEIANQITLIEFSMFKNLKSKEFLNSNWTDESREAKAPNINFMIQRSNILSDWVAFEILKRKDVKERTQVLTKFIKIAQRLEELHCFNALVGLISGLNSNPIFRLKKTWHLVPKKYMSEYERLKDITSSLSNYKGLRTALKDSFPPCVPYIGMYLKDLTFIEDGNPDKKNDLIHFSKCKLLADILKDIQFYQNTSYSILIYNEIRNLLMIQESIDSEELYQMSLKVEPRK